MNVTAIHQLVAGFSRGDAISNEAVVMRDMFRRWGYAADIFCERKRVLPELRPEARDVDDLPAVLASEDVALLHLSIGSRANLIFRGLTSRKVLLYHNITPPAYFRLIQPRTACDLELGREQAASLASAATVNLADSRFNAEELAAMGYPSAAVLPLVIDFGRLHSPPDRRTLKRFQDGKRNILFVGRCAPNKKIEDVISAFACFQKAVEPNSRLIFAGSYAGTERYHRLLVSMARDLRLEDVLFLGSVSQADLNACYRAAHVFLCMSEHEGFCIPLVEALFHGVPVLAYAAGAVPETLGGGGVLFHEKHFESVAEMLGRLAESGPLRAGVLRRQAECLRRYVERDPEAELRRHLAPFLGQGPGVRSN